MSAAAEFPWTPRHSKTELWPLFECAPLGLAQCQRHGKIIALNPALEKMLGGRSRIVPSLCFSDLIHPQKRAEGERLLAELFEQQRDSFQIDSRMITASGKTLLWTAWLVSGRNGNSDYALALAVDCPYDRASAQRLQQAEKLEVLGRLAGGVAHDFNNLLTGVLLYCDLLIATPDPGPRVRKYAEEIRNASIQATGLVRQLLAVARPTNSAPRLLSLNEVADGMRNLLIRLIGENIDLQFNLDPNLGLVKMDPTQSQQILLNLVLNARDALPGGGRIIVETSNCEIQVLTASPVGSSNPTSLPCALFVVADNGIGMDAATHAHLFEAFFTTKAGKGTGLGLATVHEIVSSNGGLIHVESAPGRGARVSVMLPLVPAVVLNSLKAPDFPSENNEEALISKESKKRNETP
jgi:two-component system, cell cycle sensor histidine kinase and response regulator CckA